LPPSSAPDSSQTRPRGQRVAAPAGMSGKVLSLQVPGQIAHGQPCRRIEHKRAHRGQETPPSRHRKLARMKAAAERSRRECRKQEGGHNPRHPWDFGAHEPPRANAKSPMAERRTSVNRSPCGRRTSLQGAPGHARCLTHILNPRAGVWQVRGELAHRPGRVQSARQIDPAQAAAH